MTQRHPWEIARYVPLVRHRGLPALRHWDPIRRRYDYDIVHDAPHLVTINGRHYYDNARGVRNFK